MFGDNVRVLEWDRPFAIPALSPRARALIRLAQSRPLPPAMLAAAYEERADKLGKLLLPSEIGGLLSVRAGQDVIRFRGGRVDGGAVAFEQVFRRSDLDSALVDFGTVSFHLAADGVSVMAITSMFQPDLAPPEVEVGSAEAVSAARAHLQELGAPPLELVSDPPPLHVLRNAAPGGGARPATLVRRANDRAYYAVQFRDPRRARAGDILVHVDAGSGDIGRVYPLGKQPLAARFKEFLGQHWSVDPVLPNLPFFDLFFCLAFDGHGTDTDGLTRFFSTTFDSGGNQYFLKSCNEVGERWIASGDVKTYWSLPTNLDFETSNLFKDADNAWDAPPNPLMPHAVNVQTWAERVLRFFKSRGYRNRRDKDKSPVQYRAYVKAGGTKNFAEWVGTTVKSDNGFVWFYPSGAFPDNPQASLSTSTDPSWVAHEFVHSVVNDILGEPLGNTATEVASISEGLGDCFAALILHESFAKSPGDLGPQYSSESIEQGPWELTRGAFRGAFPSDALTGFPNLANPYLTWFGQPLPYTYWSGQRDVQSPIVQPDEQAAKNRYEINSTLFGGVCKLMVSGGPNPVLSQSVTETGAGSAVDALAPGNLPLSASRLSTLLVESFTTAQSYPASFHDLIDVLATNAGVLAKTNSDWLLPPEQTREKVRRAFGEYGFGRGTESKANHGAAQITSALKSENVIASGLNYSRPITGSLCGTEEDFFVLNEEARDGDSVEYTLSDLLPNEKVEVRLYDELPCEFDEPGTIKTCAKLRQFYPQTDSNGATPPGLEPLPKAKADFPHKNGNRPVFVGLRIKQGLGSCVASYTLEVLLNRDSGSVYK